MSLFGDAPPILAVDVANLAWRAAYGYRDLSTSHGQPSGHIYGFMKQVLALAKRWPRARFYWALEGVPKHRRALLPEYKGNRADAADRAVGDPLPDVTRLVRLLPGVRAVLPTWEADDVLATLTHRKIRNMTRIILVTTDRDLWSYVGRTGVSVWAKDHLVDPIEVTASYGVTNPRAVTLVKALFGDTSDNIPPAAPRLRQRPLLDLINQHDLRDVAGLQSHATPTLQTRLEPHWETVHRNWSVVRLHVTPNRLQTSTGAKTSTELKDFLLQFECKSLLPLCDTLWRTP